MNHIEEIHMQIYGWKWLPWSHCHKAKMFNSNYRYTYFGWLCFQFYVVSFAKSDWSKE